VTRERRSAWACRVAIIFARRLHRSQGRALRRAAVASAQQAHRHPQKDSTHADWADKSSAAPPSSRRYASVQEALTALANDEVDAVFGDKAQLWLWSKKPEGKCCELVGQDIKDTQTLGVGVAAGLRKEDAKLREALNKAFGEMMTDGTYKKINEKYFPFALN
jgi:ABC-type amino acid transport substrate-binding protein